MKQFFLLMMLNIVGYSMNAQTPQKFVTKIFNIEQMNHDEFVARVNHLVPGETISAYVGVQFVRVQRSTDGTKILTLSSGGVNTDMFQAVVKNYESDQILMAFEVWYLALRRNFGTLIQGTKIIPDISYNAKKIFREQGFLFLEQ